MGHRPLSFGRLSVTVVINGPKATLKMMKKKKKLKRQSSGAV